MKRGRIVSKTMTTVQAGAQCMMVEDDLSGSIIIALNDISYAERAQIFRYKYPDGLVSYRNTYWSVDSFILKVLVVEFEHSESLPLESSQWQLALDNDLVDVDKPVFFTTVFGDVATITSERAENFKAKYPKDQKTTFTLGEVEGLFRKFADHVDTLYRPYTSNNVHAWKSLYDEKWFEENVTKFK